MQCRHVVVGIILLVPHFAQNFARAKLAISALPASEDTMASAECAPPTTFGIAHSG